MLRRGKDRKNQDITPDYFEVPGAEEVVRGKSEQSAAISKPAEAVEPAAAAPEAERTEPVDPARSGSREPVVKEEVEEEVSFEAADWEGDTPENPVEVETPPAKVKVVKKEKEEAKPQPRKPYTPPPLPKELDEGWSGTRNGGDVEEDEEDSDPYAFRTSTARLPVQAEPSPRVKVIETQDGRRSTADRTLFYFGEEVRVEEQGQLDEPLTSPSRALAADAEPSDIVPGSLPDREVDFAEEWPELAEDELGEEAEAAGREPHRTIHINGKAEAAAQIATVDDEYYLQEDYEELEEEEEDEADELLKEKLGLSRGAEVGKRAGWGYTFVIATLFTMFGSITIATYSVVMNSNASIPNIMVNVSVFSLLFFIIILFNRYFVLIFLSFLHHVRIKDSEEVSEDYEPMKASVLVPAYNEGVVIERSIESLLRLNYPNYEIIVIDDGSSDDTLEKARLWEGHHEWAEVKVITQRNKGKAAALNHGAAVATGDVVVCMDGDSRLAEGTLGAGMRYFSDPRVGAVAGNVKVINRINILTRLQALEYIEGLNLVRRAQAYLNAVNIVPGPIGLFRREVLLKVGGWDSDTFAEDCDLTLKILTAGYKIEYEPYAISETEAPESLLPLLKQRYRWTRGILQSMRKHRRFLITPEAGWRVVITMWQMVLEGILWPLMNILANMMFILVAILFGMSPLLVLWWVQLTILDTIAALHALAIEREDLTLVPYAVLYRLVFIQIVDVTKMLATIEELIGVRMGWGKLERKGRI